METNKPLTVVETNCLQKSWFYDQKLYWTSLNEWLMLFYLQLCICFKCNQAVYHDSMHSTIFSFDYYWKQNNSSTIWTFLAIASLHIKLCKSLSSRHKFYCSGVTKSEPEIGLEFACRRKHSKFRYCFIIFPIVYFIVRVVIF